MTDKECKNVEYLSRETSLSLLEVWDCDRLVIWLGCVLRLNTSLRQHSSGLRRRGQRSCNGPVSVQLRTSGWTWRLLHKSSTHPPLKSWSSHVQTGDKTNPCCNSWFSGHNGTFARPHLNTHTPAITVTTCRTADKNRLPVVTSAHVKRFFFSFCKFPLSQAEIFAAAAAQNNMDPQQRRLTFGMKATAALSTETERTPCKSKVCCLRHLVFF